MSPSPGRRRLWGIGATSTAVCGLATAGGWAVGTLGSPTLALPLLLLAYTAGGWEPLGRTAAALRRGELDVDLLMLIAAAGAAAVGHWVEGGILLFLFSLGNTLETYAFGRTRRSIETLMELRPDQASVLEDGNERRVPVADLEPGRVVRVRPGERIPVDGTVVAGSSRVDESSFTGEAMPVTKGAGTSVLGGTLNQSGFLDVEVTRTADDSALARVIRLVEEAREVRAPTQSWIEAIQGRYAAGVIAAAGLAVMIPWLALGWPFAEAFYRGMTLLVVASPCALVISIPATIVSAVANGARHRVLFKGGAHLDALASVTAAAFDKTGTLTVGRPRVVGVLALAPAAAARIPAGDPGTTEPDADPETWLLRLAAGAESYSEHPLAAAVLAEAERRGVEVPAPVAFTSAAGSGVEATVDGCRVRVGRRSWVEGATEVPVPHTIVGWAARDALATIVFVSVDGRHAGALAVADPVRRGAAEALDELRRAGVAHVALLTGDHRATAEEVARRVGVDEVHAELFPDDKSRIVAEVRVRAGPVAMVGDGVNDAPALAAADVGIALGAAGADVALETADVVVMGEDLSDIAYAVALSRRARAVVRQNLAFAVAVMAVLVILALGGWIGLPAGVVGHEGSTVVVVLNGLRLLGDGRPRAV